jgi:hypothetical protein
MTLEEKLIMVLYKTSSANYAAELLEKVAEEFAIGFAEFLNDCALNETLDNKSLKELLEIYKKEKGL